MSSYYGAARKTTPIRKKKTINDLRKEMQSPVKSVLINKELSVSSKSRNSSLKKSQLKAALGKFDSSLQKVIDFENNLMMKLSFGKIKREMMKSIENTLLADQICDFNRKKHFLKIFSCLAAISKKR